MIPPGHSNRFQLPCVVIQIDLKYTSFVITTPTITVSCLFFNKIDKCGKSNHKILKANKYTGKRFLKSTSFHIDQELVNVSYKILEMKY